MTATINDSANQNPASGDAGQNQSSNDPVIKDPVAFLRKHEELLGEVKSTKAKLKELQEKERLKEEEEARKRGDFEKLVKTREEEIARLQAENSSWQSRMDNASKLAAVLDASGTDIDRKWYSLIPLDEIVVNPETREVDQMTVTKTVDKLKKTWPEMFVKPGKALPTEAPQGNGAGTITRSEWMKLPYKEALKWKPSQVVG